jgi:hypothetical protein
MGYGNGGDVDARLERLERLVERLVGGRGGSDEDEFGDEDHFGEGEYDEDVSDISDMSDRFDEPDSLDAPSSMRTAGRPGGRLANGHVKDAGEAYRRYARDVNGGRVFGEDIWRFSQRHPIRGSDPLDTATTAVSRFSRSRR